jgi:hypothetical protein
MPSHLAIGNIWQLPGSSHEFGSITELVIIMNRTYHAYSLEPISVSLMLSGPST